ncbi:hypothetical protein ES703_103228 [subsurface metagenome]
MQEKKAVVPENIADSRAALIIGCGIWKLVIIPKSLSLVAGTDTSSHIQFFGNNIIPDLVDGLDVCFITCKRCHIRHA